jgi:cation:H+ antiporter
MTGRLLAAGFAVILVGAVLFTNAVEWLAHRLELGSGAAGSVLAAVATALPESTIPIVAIIGGAEGSEDVAIGAIVGAPFMLATIAMALVGLAAIGFAKRREQGRERRVHTPTLKRDLLVFLALLGAALLLGLGLPSPVRVPAALALVLAYAGYVAVTVRRGGQVPDEASLDPLAFDPTRHDPPSNLLIGLQFAVGLGAIIGGAHLFVEELLAAADAERELARRQQREALRGVRGSPPRSDQAIPASSSRMYDRAASSDIAAAPGLTGGVHRQ